MFGFYKEAEIRKGNTLRDIVDTLKLIEQKMPDTKSTTIETTIKASGTGGFNPEEVAELISKAIKTEICETHQKVEAEELRKSHTCIAFHIQAFQRQAGAEEKADVTEPCKMCPYNPGCDFAWYRYISEAIPETHYHFTLAKDCMYQPEDIKP